MLCKNCGTQIPDDSVLCPQCGAAIEKEIPQPVEAQTTQPVAETESQYAFAQPAFDAPEEKPVKKTKKGLIAGLSAAVAVLVVFAVLVGVMWPRLQGAWVEKFGTNEEYLAYVEQQSSDEFNDAVIDTYRELKDAMSAIAAGMPSAGFSSANKLEMKLTLSDKVIDSLESNIWHSAGQKVQMDWLKDVSLDGRYVSKDNLQRSVSTLKIGTTEILGIDLILDAEKELCYFGIPALTGKYLKVDMNQMLGNGDEGGATITPEGGVVVGAPVGFAEYLADEEFLELLPSEAVLEQLLAKYTGILLDNLQNVEKTTETVKVGELEQSLTALTTTITPEDGKVIATAFLQALKEDKQVEKLVKDIAGYLAAKDVVESADEAYKSFVDSIDESLASMGDHDIDDEDPIVWTNYVNGSHKVVGRRFQCGDDKFYFCQLKQGEKSALVVEMGDLKLEGQGTEKDNKINGEYRLGVRGEELFRVALLDFQSNKTVTNGKIHLIPSADVLKEIASGMGLDVVDASALTLANPKLELSFATTQEQSTVAINLLAGGEVAVGLICTVEEIASESITVPENAYNMEQVETWASEVDISKIMEALEKAGVPVELFMVPEPG